MAKEKSKKKLGMTTLIFIGLFLGAFTGIILYYFVPAGYMRDTVLVDGVFYVVGQGFLRLMQMLVVPLVFCSLICGSAAIGDTKTLGKVGVKTIVFYLFTTAWRFRSPLRWERLSNRDLDWIQLRFRHRMSL